MLRCLLCDTKGNEDAGLEASPSNRQSWSEKRPSTHGTCLEDHSRVCFARERQTRCQNVASPRTMNNWQEVDPRASPELLSHSLCQTSLPTSHPIIINHPCSSFTSLLSPASPTSPFHSPNLPDPLRSTHSPPLLTPTHFSSLQTPLPTQPFRVS